MVPVSFFVFFFLHSNLLTAENFHSSLTTLQIHQHYWLKLRLHLFPITSLLPLRLCEIILKGRERKLYSPGL